MDKKRNRQHNTLKIHKRSTVVGDVEVSTAILVHTPEHDKLKNVGNASQAIGDFLAWLSHERGIALTEPISSFTSSVLRNR